MLLILRKVKIKWPKGSNTEEEKQRGPMKRMNDELKLLKTECLTKLPKILSGN